MSSNFSPFQESIEHVFYADRVPLNFAEFELQRLYYESETKDFIPFPETAKFVPAEYIGKTNQELFDEWNTEIQFGWAIGRTAEFYGVGCLAAIRVRQESRFAIDRQTRLVKR